MFKRTLITLTLASLLLSACAAARSTAPQAPGLAPEAQSQSGFTSNPAKNAYSDATTPAEATGAGNSQGSERLVIRNATLTILVTDPIKVMEVITQMATDMAGFVVSSNTYKVGLEGGGEAPEASITIRIPADRLTEALTKIKTQVKDPNKDVLSENVTGQDVTKEYTDLKSRLTNLEDAEAQLREIMASATKPEDVLNVFNQLTQVREQIEVLKGQIQYYEESAAMSAISVTIRASETVKPLSIGGWQPVGVARDALQTTLSGIKFLANAAIWLVLFVIPIGLVLYLFVRLVIFLFRRLRKPRTPRAAVPPAPPVTPAA